MSRSVLFRRVRRNSDPITGFRIYLIPVEANSATGSYGDPVPSVVSWGISRGVHLNVRYPIFAGARRSWAANHPTDPAVQYETEILADMAAWEEADIAAGRELDSLVIVSFSAGGYGAFTLLARHITRFDGVVAFDSPMTTSGFFADSADTYGTLDNFRDNYRLIDAPRLTALAGKKLVLAGYFHDQTEMTDYAALVAGPRTAFLDTKFPKHHWLSGWLWPALDAYRAVAQLS